jgi:hypothetical protein
MIMSVNNVEPEIFGSPRGLLGPIISGMKKRYNKPKEERCEAIIKVVLSVRDLMKHECRKDQSYSDYILDLINYKKEHERLHNVNGKIDGLSFERRPSISETLKPGVVKKLE